MNDLVRDINALVVTRKPAARDLPAAAARPAVSGGRAAFTAEQERAAATQIGNEEFTEESRETVTVTVTSTIDPDFEVDVEAITKLVLVEIETGRRLTLNFTPPA